MEAIFSFKPAQGYRAADRLKNLLIQPDFHTYIQENYEIDLTITLEPTNSKGEKKRMYRYLNGPLLDAVMQAMRHSGDPVDKATAMIEMKVLFAKDIYVDQKGVSFLILMSQSDMSKKRLLDFIRDIIFHIEKEFGWNAPDSESYNIP